MADTRVCVDANILVDVFAQQATEDNAVRDHSLWVLQAAERGDHQLVIPASVIAETFGAGDMRRPDASERQKRADAVKRARDWLRNGRFLVVEVDQRLATLAGELAQALNMKGADALVLAAAQQARCATVYTRDRQMLAKHGRAELGGLAVKAPQRVEVPEQQAINLAAT